MAAPVRRTRAGCSPPVLATLRAASWFSLSADGNQPHQSALDGIAAQPLDSEAYCVVTAGATDDAEERADAQHVPYFKPDPRVY